MTWLHTPQEAAGGIDLTVTVLTHTHWPIPLTPVPCRLPEELTTTFDTFKAYYLKRFSGRRLQYNPTMGSADLRANFPKRRHEIQVPTPVMAILLLFNDRDVYTYAVRAGRRATPGAQACAEPRRAFRAAGNARLQELQETLELPEPELRRHLQSLVLGKYRLLTKVRPSRRALPRPARRALTPVLGTGGVAHQENKTRDIEPTERIRYNEQFSANLVRLKIQQIAVKAEADPERKETQDRVEEDRKYEYPRGGEGLRTRGWAEDERAREHGAGARARGRKGAETVGLRCLEILGRKSPLTGPSLSDIGFGVARWTQRLSAS